MPTYTKDVGSAGQYTDLNGHVQFASPGESVQTYQVLGDGWTKTADTPYYQLSSVSQQLTFSAADEVQSVSGLLSCTVIRVEASMDITIRANSNDSTAPYVLQAGEIVDLRNSCNIETLYLTATAPGSAVVHGLLD